MKKGLIGCLVIGLLLFVVGGGVVYFKFLKPHWDSMSAGMDSVKELAKIGESTAKIQNQSEFTPPADGALTPAQISMFVAVQEAMQTELAGEVEEFKAKGEAMEAKAKAEGHEVGPSDAMGLMSGMTSLIAKGRQIQAEQLNRSNTSQSEYAWVRNQVFQALPFAGADAIPDSMKDQVNAKNVELVRPHKELFSKAMGTMMLGM